MSELSNLTPAPSQDAVKPLPLNPCSLRLSRNSVEEPTFHPAVPAARLAELFLQLCFLSCSQYTLPQICLASFFLPCSLAAVRAVSLLPDSGLGSGAGQLRCCVWMRGVSPVLPASAVCLSRPRVQVCAGLEVGCPLSSPETRTLWKTHCSAFSFLQSFAKKAVERGENPRPLTVQGC